MRRCILPVFVAMGSVAALATACSLRSNTGDPPPEGPFGAGGSSSGGGSFGGPAPLRPDFGSTVTASVPPPPISGGTLLMLKDGHTAVAADPDRDAVYVVDVSAKKLLFTTALQPGDEPGRLVEDAAGHVHVALRRGGALVTVDPTTGSVLARRAVCPAPRGVAYDATADAVWVACATGELVSLPAAGGAATATHVVERDLRDVVIQNGAMFVSEFRSAQVLQLASDGTIAERTPMPFAGGPDQAHVAWRMIAGPSNELVISHQEESTLLVPTHQQGAYGGGGSSGGSDGGSGSSSGGAPGSGTSGLVDSVVTVLGGNGGPVSFSLPDMVLPVDVALSPDGSHLAVVAAANAFIPGIVNVRLLRLDGAADDPLEVGPDGRATPTAVAFDGSGDLLVQTREPAALWVVPNPHTAGQALAQSSITLSTDSRADTAHDIFHTMAGAPIACASCHPEGGDDGHVWMLDGQPRRTPSLRGTIAGTAPYHWPGDEPDIAALADDVYTVRMNGAQLTSDQLSALKGWVEAIPAPPAPSWLDSAAVARGQAIFQRTDVGCASCHSGAKLTDNATVDVGTGGPFQVPPLVGVGWRAPLLHDGCAKTLTDRFTTCATPRHGSISALSTQDVSDLVAYLESL